MHKGVIAALAIFLIAAGAMYAGARYLLTKLDGAGAPAPQEQPEEPGMQRYASEEGYSFLYPDSYEISSHPGAPGEGDVLVLLPKGYVPPVGGEGPPTIAVSSYAVPHGTALEPWIRSDPRSNFGLSTGGLAPTTLGGKPAFSYHYSGLYETNAVAAAHNGRIIIFSVGWLSGNDPVVRDFERLLPTVQFN